MLHRLQGRILPGQVQVGWIGTGIMGNSMCGHLVKAGFKAQVFNRTRSREASLLEQGATSAESLASLARASDIIVSIVGYPSDVEEVYLGEQGLLAHAKPGSILIDMTTSSPNLAQRIAEVAAKRDLHVLDAPVSGGDIGAREARLSIMVGGDRLAFDAVLPLLQYMGKTIVHQGQAGSGQHTKLVNQTLIASNMVGVCEALLYASRAGLNLDSVLQSVSPGAAGSWSLTHLAPRIMQGDFQPGFLVDHFVKDMGLVLAEAQRMRLAVPGLALAHQLYVALQASGGGSLGTQGLYQVLKKLSS